jgi:hypothetical protein
MDTTTADANPQTIDQSRPQPLTRPVNIRIVLVVLAFVGGAGVPIYLACWLLIPEEGSDQSIVSGFFQSRQTRSL